MALIHCPECGKDVSTYAAVCPHCGCPIQKEEKSTVPSVPQKQIPIYITWSNLSPAALTGSVSIDNQIVGTLKLHRTINSWVTVGVHSIKVESFRGHAHNVSGEQIDVPSTCKSVHVTIKWKGGIISQYHLVVAEVKYA